jgi:hypothetical protein
MNGGPGGTTPKVYLVTRPDQTGLPNEIILATVNPDNLYEKIQESIRNILEFDTNADRAAFNLDADVERDLHGRSFSAQLTAFLEQHSGKAGGESYSVPLEFTVLYDVDENGEESSETYELIISKLEGEMVGGHRKKPKKTRKLQPMRKR